MISYDEAQRVADRCRKMERSLTEVGLHEISVVLHEAFLAIEDLIATYEFGRYQDARRESEGIREDVPMFKRG